MKEKINHYIYDCVAYDEDRKMLEKDIERILAAYGLQHIPDINLTLMTGNLEEAPRAANLELRGALAGCITRTGRFTVKNLIFCQHIYNLLEGLFLQSEFT